MSLVALSEVPVLTIGHSGRQGTSSIAALSTTTLDAANEAVMMIGRLYWEDGGSHTVNTSGSSSIQWRTSSSTFANGSTTVKVGIAPIDAAAGPPARALNSSDVIAFDVAAVFTGSGGGITTAAWQTSVPTTGTKTITSGDLVVGAIQMTTRGGADSILVSTIGALATASQPCVTEFTGAAYANSARLPNMVVVASDGSRGYFLGGYVASVGSSQQNWNNTSGTKEYGNILRFPVPVRAYGIVVGCTFSGDCDLVLYSDPLGTPAAQKTVSVDLNTIGVSSAASDGRFPFTSTYDLAANTDYAVIAKPSSATNVGMPYKTYNDANHQKSDGLGTNCYAVNRNAGAFAAQNSRLDRFAIGLLVGAFEHGVQPQYALGI